MEALVLIVGALSASIGFAWLARWWRIPYPVVLLLAGVALGLGLGTRVPPLDLDPELILAIVLPAVLYPAAISTAWLEFRTSLRPILMLAIGLVVATTLAVGCALKWLVPGMPWAVAFAFGAIVSPPDAVAASAVLKRFPLPPRLVTVLEGESLVNDASGLVLYRIAVAAALSGVFSGWDLVGQFALIGVGGVAVGLAVGWLTTRIQPRLGDSNLATALGLVTPFIAYLVAEALQLSGVLSIVAVGLYRVMWSHEGSNALTRLNITAIWNAVVFVVNCLVFLLMGLELPHVVSALLVAEGAMFTWQQIILFIGLLSLVAIVVRFMAIFGVNTIEGLLPHKAGRRERTPPASLQTIASWAGMRGIVSLAAALALPRLMPDGSPFPHRDLLILLTIGVIVVTLVGQGITLPWLIQALAIKPLRNEREALEQTRNSLREAAMRAIDEEASGGSVDPDELARVRHFYDYHSRHRYALHGHAIDPEARLWLSAMRAQRAELVALWRRGTISDSIMQKLEHELDLSEARASDGPE